MNFIKKAMLRAVVLILGILWGLNASVSAKEFTLISPDGKLVVSIEIGEQLTYSLKHEGQLLLKPSPLSMTLSTGEIWGSKARLQTSKQRRVDEKIISPLYKKSLIRDHYNELALSFKGQWAVEFRAYDDGLAYRFISTKKEKYNIQREEVAYQFPADLKAIVPFVTSGKDGDFESQYPNSFENLYTEATISALNKGRLLFLPALVKFDGGKCLLISESNLESYPGLFLTSKNGQNLLSGVMAPYPKEVQRGGYNQIQNVVKSREDFIAKVQGARSFPWRIAMVSTQDKDLANSDMTYRLAAPSRLSDLSWIKPGKVAWDWWNFWNLKGVDFEAGINNDTYKYYIDFAAKYGVEYVILDEGWSVLGKADLMQVIPEIDIKELVNYAKMKGVGIILWAGWAALDRDMEKVCKYYSELGVKGFKVDFMDRDDQQLNDFNWRVAEVCAKYHLVLDLHGMYKPAGMNRTYPNVLNFEGVHGLEQMKWAAPDKSEVDQMRYDVSIPFLRQVAGPMDYTQGAMRNATHKNFVARYYQPMSQGTRCHQLATYVIFESPLNMLCDSPTNYEAEPECTSFIAQIPTTWDESITLDGHVGEYVVTARRKGDTWYIGALTNWTPRDLTIDLNALPIKSSEYQLTSFIDGKNAHRDGEDYKVLKVEELTAPLQLHLAPGGGAALLLKRK